MRVKKVRGHKKLWKQIEQWEQQNLHLDLDNLRYRQREYARAALSPYSNYPVLDISYSEPFGKTRQK
ncbi:hypothetical protein, partial [Longispora fulva]|uniref:hypothetical protein n=2 Tax=Bacteria TaxID=2 RepID=UPI00362E4A24